VILESLELENFRQFIGKNTIEFSAAPKNTTIIFGENGRGKTGIYRAVMFCLFGDHLLSQDGGVRKEDILHVNTSAVQRGTAKGETTLAKVRLTFTHDCSRFVMERVTKAGGIIQIAAPHFYTAPQTITDVIDTVVNRTLQLLFPEKTIGRIQNQKSRSVAIYPVTG